MKRFLSSLALGALVCCVLAGGVRTARAQDACAPVPRPKHSLFGRLCDLAHTPAPAYRPTHYTDWFWNAAGHAMMDKHLIKCLHPEDECAQAPPAHPLTGPPQGPNVGPDRPVPAFLRGLTPPDSSHVSPAYKPQSSQAPAPAASEVYYVPAYDFSQEYVAPPPSVAPTGPVRPNR